MTLIGLLTLTIRWYWPILVMGILAFPLTKKILHPFPDYGYVFAKTVAVLLVSYVAFILGDLRLLPFNQLDIILLIAVMGFLNIIFFTRHDKEKAHKTDKKPYLWHLIIFEELLFFTALLFWTYVRSQEPSLRSLEKFMDFGFINSILRSNYFPPADIWYPPYPINYYYFGHLTGAVLIKLTGIKPSIGYNLILATLFALGITQAFSLVMALIMQHLQSVTKTAMSVFRLIKIVCVGLLGSFIMNLGGNLHTIYLFTTGYPNEQPVPFWQILTTYNPAKYWYPNATRFIPYTIHEFPSYSYVVADLHGHVFDIPFVLLTIAILFIMFTQNHKANHVYKRIFNFKFSILNQFLNSIQISNFPYRVNKFQIFSPVLLGFMTAIHYMTNAFDGPIYILLSLLVFFSVYGFSLSLIVSAAVIGVSFIVFSLPFSHFFTPFVNGIGVNCSPQFLTNIGRIGPFLFEKGNCQISPLWMLFILWGFFWIGFILLALVIWITRRNTSPEKYQAKIHTDTFIMILFSFSLFLTVIPEFFYIKDIYPLHFRANTMFKLGYQAFIMMSISCAYTFFRIKLLVKKLALILSCVFVFFFIFVAIYPLFSVPSYYGGTLTQKPDLDGSQWLSTQYPEDKEIIDYLNWQVTGQPVILEAQGDSYTDYERISANTGLPTVAGWWVHEWLWRGSSNIIAQRIPEVVTLYESSDIAQTRRLIQKYQIKYVIVSRMERQKYVNIDENKFLKLGKLVYRSINGFGALYQVN